jgi:hypothetical protein
MRNYLTILFLSCLGSACLTAQDIPTSNPVREGTVQTPASNPSPDVPEVVPLPPSDPISPPTVSEENVPAPYPTTPKKTELPQAPKAPRVIPQSYGDTTGDVYLGQRTVVDRYAGWGWICREKETWRKARWVILEEKTGSTRAPGRFLGHPDSDNGTQYKLYGQWAPYKGYEPNFDVFVDVFQIKGFELIGPAEIPKMSPPRSNRGRSTSEGTFQRGAGVTR